MQQHLYKFLVLHRKLGIPQLGSFFIQDEPARIDRASGLLFAPKPAIHFSETTVPLSDKLFFGFLSEEMDVDEVTAIREFHDFCYRFRDNIQQNQPSVLPGIGRIIRGPEDTLAFTAETSLLDLLPPIPWENVPAVPDKRTPNEIRKALRKQQAEMVEELSEETHAAPDRWWIYAIILLVTGAIALLFYYQ